MGRSAEQLARLPAVGYIYLGEVPYGKALELQSKLCRRRIDEIYSGPPGTRVPREQRRLADSLILLQHAPVYTNGRRNHGKLPAEDIERLRQLSCEYFETNRGGEITFHGPGQLVAYPNLYLRDHFLGTKCYVEGLENTVIETCAQFGVDADRQPGFPGVWVSPTQKIAALGTHVQKYVTSHGFALNCTTDLKWFNQIIPCGLEGKTAASLQSVLEQNQRGATDAATVDVTVDSVLPVVVDSFRKVYGCDIRPLEHVSPATCEEIAQLLK
ncbi:lipoyltransferase [Martensiomyces pterosporus]|nr:lipoyltransferase [Martensiomyces pterosporus]